MYMHVSNGIEYRTQEKMLIYMTDMGKKEIELLPYTVFKH